MAYSNDGLLHLAVYLRSVQKQQQFYTQRGRWCVLHSRIVDYVIPGFTDPETVATLYPYIPDDVAPLLAEARTAIEGGLPRSVGEPVLRAMLAFRDRSDQVYQENAAQLDQLHDFLAHEEEPTRYTLEEIAYRALGITEEDPLLDEVTLFAVHQAIRRNLMFFIDNDRGSMANTHYLVQPRRVARIVDTVTDWVDGHTEYLLRSLTGDYTPEDGKRFRQNHPMEKFLEKARRLILNSRRFRSPTIMSAVGPSKERFDRHDPSPFYREVATEEEFDANDRKILTFLVLFCIPPWHMTDARLKSAAAHIMRATRMYNSLLANSASAPLFLQELGVFAPWENLRVLDPFLALSGHGISARSDEMWEDSVREAENVESAVDSMADMRTDWGDLPIYCIDAATAHEIDDGVSLERVDDDTFWVRVHVANPSAFIKPYSPIMETALDRCQTVYLPERTYPLLPSSLSQGNFSLAAGRPTLTFSAKMDARKGEVLDIDVRNGTARNVIYLTHDTLRDALGGPSKIVQRLRVGCTADQVRESNQMEEPDKTEEPDQMECARELRSELSSGDKSTFHTLRKLMLGFRDWRISNGALELPGRPEPSVTVDRGMKLYSVKEIPNRGRYFLGDPIINVDLERNLNPHEIPDMSKSYLVSLLMNLACWISGRWCAERNIPAVYDGTWCHPEYKPLTKDNLSEYAGDKVLQYCPPIGTSSSEPIQHSALGLDVYVKSTSPLRRFSDLLVHYQIEAMLRHEKSTAASGDSAAPLLPFPREAVDQFIRHSWFKRSRINHCQTSSKQFWACQFLFRALYFDDSPLPLPSSFTCLLHQMYRDTPLAASEFDSIVESNTLSFSGVMVALGVKCQVIIPETLEAMNGGEKKGEEVDVLSIVKARILSVDMSRLIVVLEAVEFVRHFERVGEWA